MYYDRSIAAELADTLIPGGPLAWLMAHVRSDMGRSCHAHLAFRKTCSGARRRGSIQLYWGRTSPLEIQVRRGSQVRLNADKAYRRISEPLFSKALPLSRLGQLEDDLQDHLGRVKDFLAQPNPRRRAFVTGEAICHAGLIRRYGHGWRPGDPLVAVDSEVRIGFANRAEQENVDAVLRNRLSLPPSEALPRKLDTLGVLRTGDIVLVEVKDATGSIERAAVQLAAHMMRFSDLMANSLLRNAVQELLNQKRAVGVIHPGGPQLRATVRLVPWLAAPDESADWPASWRKAIHRCGKKLGAVLNRR